jgi:serine/threonine protein kinase
MARCHHFFLVPLIGFTTESPSCIATEFMPGGSLDAKVRIRKGGGMLTGTQLTMIAMGVAHALAHVHSLGIVHRDIKTSNISTTKAGTSNSVARGSCSISQIVGSLQSHSFFSPFGGRIRNDPTLLDERKPI